MIRLTKPFGNTGKLVAAVGQGSWKSDSDGESDAIAALRLGMDLGLTHIDTAEMYGGGAAESVIAKAIAGRRDEVFLVSKVLPSNASHRGTLNACEKSLKHLKTDHLDCYLLHWRGSHPLEETVGAFEELKRDGKILSWGVSNFDVGDLQELANAGAVPACNQVLYHLKERAIEHAVIPWCQGHGIAVVAYTPFGQTLAIFDGAGGAAKTLADVASRHGATTRQVALAFLLRFPNTFVIPKASGAAHVRDNAAAQNLKLSPDELAAIDAAFPLGRKPRTLPTI
ncbi:MAG TPA: aldo/keto reductase [Steroidobacteraceae bacterium]|jgi:diketogulonate reductase-like aldo/keto reductase